MCVRRHPSPRPDRASHGRCFSGGPQQPYQEVAKDGNLADSLEFQEPTSDFDGFDEAWGDEEEEGPDSLTSWLY